MNCISDTSQRCRGYVQCLKLSPNLRKQTKEYKAALISDSDKTAYSCEVRQLKSLLDMVKDPDAEVEVGFEEEEEVYV